MGGVARVIRTPVNPQDVPAGQASALLKATQSREPRYHIGVVLQAKTIKAYGEPQSLKPGMALEADVVLAHGVVSERLLEPVLATAARMKVLGDVPTSARP